MKTIKCLCVIMSVLALSACTPETSDVSERYQLPEELSACKVYRMDSSRGSRLTVLHCPNAQTTTIQNRNKVRYNTTVIDQ